MRAIVGRAARTLATATVGLALGFEVAVSVFADGAWDERLVIIAVLLLLYGLAGAALGFGASSWYGLGLALPGVSALAWFAAKGEGYWWYLPYAALIVALAVGGAHTGGALHARRRPAGGGAAA